MLDFLGRDCRKGGSGCTALIEPANGLICNTIPSCHTCSPPLRVSVDTLFPRLVPGSGFSDHPTSDR